MPPLILTTVDTHLPPASDVLPRTPWGLSWYFIRQVRRPALLILLVEAVSLVFYNLEPLFLKYLIDGITTAGQPNWTYLWQIFALFALCVYVLQPLFARGSGYLYNVCLAPYFESRIEFQLLRYVHGHSLAYFQNDFAGRISSKINNVASAITAFLNDIRHTLLEIVITLGMAGLLLASVHPLLLAAFVAWLAVYSLFIFICVPGMPPRTKVWSDAVSLYWGTLVDSLGNIMAVKLFGRSGDERQHIAAQLHTSLGKFRKVSGYTMFLNIMMSVLSFLLGVPVIGLALWGYKQGWLGSGDVVLALTVLPKILSLSWSISRVATDVFDRYGRLQDGIETLIQPHTVEDLPRSKAFHPGAGEIVFKDVTFHYGKQDGVLDTLNLRIAPGEKVGLVGRSGAGKTTLVNLLLRFYDVQAGEIRVDGQNIATLRQDSLRTHIAMVTQDPSLFHRSIADNIRYGRPDANDAEVTAAAKKAHAHTFIKDLSDSKGRQGYEAFVGERGVKLSGGQRQRIAIARVILKNSPILILDEATSALDSEVEEAIQENLSLLMDGKTVIAIAHRLSTLRQMDRIVVLDGGRLVEEGSHAALLRKGGLYAKLWKRQSGGFLGD